MFRSRKNAIAVRLIPALVLALSVASPAEGSLFRIDFSGNFGAITASGPGFASPRFTGSLIYDDSIPLGAATPNPLAPALVDRSYGSGVFRASNPTPDGTGLDIKIAGVSVAPESNGLVGGLEVGTNGDGREFSRLSLRSPATSAPYEKGVSILFQPNDPALLSDGKIPLGLKLSDLSRATISVNTVMYGKVYDDSMPFVYTGEIDSMTITPIPEPTWTVAVLMGAAIWTVRRRLRRV